MTKFDCNSFRITVNTNFKKKLSAIVWENGAEATDRGQPIPFIFRSLWGNEILLCTHYYPYYTCKKKNEVWDLVNQKRC